MNTCAWCNASVDDDKTIWIRKNILIGHPFCSRKCATQWKDNKDSNVSSSDNNVESNSKSLEEIRYEQEQRKLLNEKNEQENIETAKKIMLIISKLLPYWKVMIPIIVVVLGGVYYLNEMYGQILLYIYILLIVGAIWAYFTAPKSD